MQGSADLAMLHHRAACWFVNGSLTAAQYRCQSPCQLVWRPVNHMNPQRLWLQLARLVKAPRSPSKRRPRQGIAAIEQPTDAATAVQALPGDGAAPARPTDAALPGVPEGVSGTAADGPLVTLQPPVGDVTATASARSDAGGTDAGSCHGTDAEEQQPAPLAALPQPSVRAEDTGTCGGSGVVSGAGAAGDDGVLGDADQLEATAGQVSSMMEQMIQRVDAAQSSADDADHPGSEGRITDSEVSAEQPAAGCAETSAAQAGAAADQEQPAEHDIVSSGEASGNAPDQQTGSDALRAAEQTDKAMAEEPLAANHTDAADSDADAARQPSGDAAEESVAVAAPAVPQAAGADGADMHAAAAMDRCDKCGQITYGCASWNSHSDAVISYPLFGDRATAAAKPSNAAVL